MDNDTISVTLRKDVLPWLMAFLSLELEDRAGTLVNRRQGVSLHPENAAIETRAISCLGHLIHQITAGCVNADFNALLAGDAADSEIEKA
jgi:hypothetical protein